MLHCFKVQRVLIEFNIILRLFKLYSEKRWLVSTRTELAPRFSFNFFLFDISIQKMIKIIFEMLKILKNKLKNKSIKEKKFQWRFIMSLSNVKMSNFRVYNFYDAVNLWTVKNCLVEPESRTKMKTWNILSRKASDNTAEIDDGRYILIVI